MSNPKNKSVLFNDFQAQWRQHGKAVLEAVSRVGESGWLILGKEVAAFERELADHWGLPHCIGCASGLDAIEIALRCAGLQPGDKVLTTPLSAFATSLAITRAGGVPVFVDVDESGQLDLELCQEALSNDESIRYLVPVHLYGHALDLERLRTLRNRYSLRIVEDCAQAIGARSRGAPVGSVGDFAATSFYPTKNLGAMGDGGALLTASDEGAAAARTLRDYGQTGKFRHEELGLNSRLDEVHAAILRSAFLPRLRTATQRRLEIANRYRDEIDNHALVAPDPPDGSESVWHLYPLLVSGRRDSLQGHLQERGIASGVHYPILIPEQKALSSHRADSLLTPFPRAMNFAENEISIPIHPFITESDIDRVIRACNGWRS